MIGVDAVASVDRLGSEWDALFASGAGLQSRRAWFRATEQAALPPGAVPHVLAVRDGTEPIGLLPMQTAGGGLVVSLTSPYTTAFQPLLAAGADPVAIGHALGRHLRRWPLARIEALDPAWPGLVPLAAGFRRAGLVPQQFQHFGNWRQSVAGPDGAGQAWAAYLAGRPGVLRETIRRRGRAVAKDPSIRIEVVRGTEGLAAVIAAYEAVYARSWKEPEPYPRFNETLLPLAAAMGVLRMAVLWQGATPLAAQYWTVVDGVATVLKLAHDDGAKALSPGTVLTAHMIRLLLEEEAIHTLDFGRGDDPYKASWTTVRQQRVGLMLANPLRPAGLAEIARHTAGRMRRAGRSLLGRKG